MITVLQQPNTWIGAYLPNLFRFQISTSLGAYSGATFTNGIISITPTVGDEISFTFSSFNYSGVITSLASNTINALSLTATTPSGTPTSVQVTHKSNQPCEISILTGRIPLNQQLTEKSSIKAIPRDRIYSCDVSGILQDLYSNIQPPPVVGIDNELYFQYLLKVNFFGAVYELGTVKNSVYSTTQSTSTGYQLLRSGAIEIFNSKKSIYSYTLGNRVTTLLL
jgi:hypothetical protein